ncbi:unnamed protein product, partial [Phaeothamnion confervicola]
QVLVLRHKVETLEADLSRRQESYVRRERASNVQIEELEEELAGLKTGKMTWMQGDAAMAQIKEMHARVMANVEMVQDRTSRILQDHERDLLRAFRARLFDVQMELERERARKDDGAGAWIERAKETEAELDRAKETADRLDRANEGLGRENARLKGQFRMQEDDRTFLIRQLVAVKKENALLRQQTREEARRDTEAAAGLQQQRFATGLPGVVRRPSTSNSLPNLATPPAGGLGSTENRYKEMIKRLKRLLDAERRGLRHVRAAYAADLQERTDLERMLRRCVQDVREEIAARAEASARAELGPCFSGGGMPACAGFAGGGGAGGRSGPAASAVLAGSGAAGFGPAERERTLELLLSQERVIGLLYSKAFP